MFSAELAHLQMVLQVIKDRTESAREDRGASTLELAIIAAILGLAALTLAGLIAAKVASKGSQISGY